MLTVAEDTFLELELLRGRLTAIAQRDARREALIHAQEAMIRSLLAENAEYRRQEGADGEPGHSCARDTAVQGV